MALRPNVWSCATLLDGNEAMERQRPGVKQEKLDLGSKLDVACRYINMYAGVLCLFCANLS